MTLETITSSSVHFTSLRSIIHEVDLATVQTAAQITTETERLNNPYSDLSKGWELTNRWFWTADSALYRVEDGEAVLYLGSLDTNLIFKNPTEAFKQLGVTENFRPSKEDIESVITKATRYKLSDLGLKQQNREVTYFEINTSNYSTLNPTQRAFAEQVYGKENFTNHMKKLQKRGIESTRIYVLNPNYVKETVTEDSALVRLCGLDANNYSSGFIANGRYVGYPDVSLRGVRKPITEGDK